MADEDALEHLDVVDDARHVERDTSGLAEPTEEGVFLVLSRVPPSPIWVVWVTGFEGSDNLKLIWVVLIEERDRNTHNALVVARNRVGKRHFDRVVIVVPVVCRLALDLRVLAEPQIVLDGHQGQILVPAAVVQIGVPADALNANVLDAIFVDAPASGVQRIVVWDAELTVPAVDGDPHPQSVGFDKRKDLLVGERLDVTDDQELLSVLHELSDVFLEEGKGRVGDHDVRLFQKRDALGAAEVAPGVLVVAIQRYPGGLVPLEEKLNVGHVRSAVAVLVFHTVEGDGERLGLLALAIPLAIFREQGALAGDGGAIVAGGDELFEAELIEVGSEVLEEVALEGVVAVAVDDLAAEGVGGELPVGLDLLLDVNILGVEFVLLGYLRGAQASVQRLAFHGVIGFLGFP